MNGAEFDAVFRPVRAAGAAEETRERLLQLVRLGVLGAGARLPPERELAERLAVSRMTLREALRALAVAGYVESRRGRYGGTFVAGELPAPRRAERPSAGELDDLLRLRRVVEPGAAELAAARPLSSAARRHLTGTFAEAEAAAPAEYRRRDSRLHLAIAEVTASGALTTAVADVRVRIAWLLDEVPLTRRERSDAEHAAILEAILAGDPAAARAAMAVHVEGTASLLRSLLPGR
ncbi:FadR/GntR family transcriptional regulator [Amycolatopsis eburnea]|uniref:FadR family transcriptional regulator n=1 Tax=Amycolatopsis eburnea TaxID=2267691 RepID=A0A3R9DK46_9PSEU|nr:GntR family transcriptional regulator [Amycolatopsis eburnea]RSD19471.1 FadR family transcriptional regulator [Amycolatopsis eburnea]